jgi:hypothetical protein
MLTFYYVIGYCLLKSRHNFVRTRANARSQSRAKKGRSLQHKKSYLQGDEDDEDDEIHQHGMSLFDKFSKEDDNNDCQREIQQESDEKSNGYLDDPPTTKEMEIV